MSSLTFVASVAVGLALFAAVGLADPFPKLPPSGLDGIERDTVLADVKGAAKRLEEQYAGKRAPEAVQMLIAIAKGSSMGAGSGWFGPARTRFTWTWLKERCGVEPAKEAITAKHFPGSAEAFARLDRDKDGAITPADLDWSDRNPYVQQSYMINRMFRFMDGQGDGKLSREELLAFFDKIRGDKDHATTDDLRDALIAGISGSFRPGDAPTPEQLVKGLFTGEIGSPYEGPDLDHAAPLFTLGTHESGERIALRDRLGKRPVVLVFGNFTCGPFRSFYPGVDELHARYRDHADFLMIYVREAHPTDGWRMISNDNVGVAVKQPTDLGERRQAAGQFCTKLQPNMPVLVDDVADPVGHAYSAMPARLYLIDAGGKVAYKGGRGPFGFRVGELEQALVMALLERQTASPARGG